MKLLIKLRTIILIFLTHKIALPLLKVFRRPNVFPYNMGDLKAMPSGSLGNDLFIFLEQRNLPLLKHYARHDLKHVLLGYDTNEEGEVCLQSFMLGNGRISFPVLATVIYGWLTMPVHHIRMKAAFQKGKRCNSIHKWEWSKIVYQSTAELRKRIYSHEKI